MRKIWNLRLNDKTFYDNLRIFDIWSALGSKELGIRVFNKRVCWETGQKIPKT